MSITPPSFVESVRIVAAREIRQRVLAKSFVITTLILLALVVGGLVFVPKLLSAIEDDGAENNTIAVVEQTKKVVQSLPDYTTEEAESVAQARQWVSEEKVDAAVLPGQGPGVKVVSLKDTPEKLVSQLTITPEVEQLSPADQQPFLAYILGVGFGVLWMMSALTFGLNIANAVVEEKQTRIVEILLSVVSSRALLTGKILGNSIVALLQIALLVAAAGVGLQLNDSDALSAFLGEMNLAAPLIWFVVLFLVGFIMVSTLYAAAASLVSRTEDLQTTAQPITWLIMAPYFLIIAFHSNTQVLTVLSYVPFSSTVAMPTRMAVDPVQWWEPVVSMLILIVTTALVTIWVARIYRNGLLHMGKRMKWKELLPQRNASTSSS